MRDRGVEGTALPKRPGHLRRAEGCERPPPLRTHELPGLGEHDRRPALREVTLLLQDADHVVAHLKRLAQRCGVARQPFVELREPPARAAPINSGPPIV